MKTVEQLAREAGLHIYPEYSAAFQRFHDAAIAQYRESLLAGVGEPVAWRYHSVSPFADKDGMCKVSDKWSLIEKPDQRDAHSACCGMEAYPLYTADQLAAAVAIERERLASMDWTTTLREGALVTWGDAETLGDRVAAAIRGQR